MKTNNTDVVEEYLREVDQRLAGLPVLQRRELLADLRAHIAAERAERDLRTEGEVIEVLERLGSPEVVAAAAHEQAGLPAVPPARRVTWRSPWAIAAIVVGVLVVLALCGGLAFAVRSGDSGSAPTVAPAAR